MLNYKSTLLDYNVDAIMKILDRQQLPQDNCVDLSACSNSEIHELSKILNLGTPIKSILYFRMGKMHTGLIHQDYNPYFPLLHALNLPLSGCDQVYMKWFRKKDSNANITTFDGPTDKTPIPLLGQQDAVCIDTVVCNHPLIVKIDDWHSIENRSSEHCGHLISIRFMHNVNKLQLMMNGGDSQDRTDDL